MPSIDRQIGISGGWIAGPSAGLAMMAAPEYLHFHPIATAVCFWVGIIVFIISVGHVFYVQWQEEGKKLSGPVLVMFCGLAIFFIGFSWWVWPKEAKVPFESAVAAKVEATKDDSSRPSLLDLFMTDFKTTSLLAVFRHNVVFKFKNGERETIFINHNFDYVGNSRSIYVYIPNDNGYEKIATYIAHHINDISKEQFPISYDAKLEGDSNIMRQTDIIFNGRVSLYIPTIFDPEIAGDLTKKFRQVGCSVQLRGVEYRNTAADNLKKYNVAPPSSFKIDNGFIAPKDPPTLLPQALEPPDKPKER